MKVSRIGNSGLLKRIFILAGILLLTGCSSASSSVTGGYSGMDYLKAGDYSTAVRVYETAISEDKSLSSQEDNYRGLGIALMGQGKYEEAAEALEISLGNSGPIPSEKEFDINYYLGTCYFKLEQYDKALAVYDAIVTLRPRDAYAKVCRGYVKAAMGDADGMDEDFRKAIEQDPTNYEQIVSIYQKMEEYGYAEQGKKYLTQILSQQSSSMDDYSRGLLSFYAGDYTAAKTALEKSSGRNNFATVIMLGKTYEALGDFNYANSVYEAYLARDKSHPEVYNQLGLCLIQRGDYQGALEAFEAGLEMGGGAITQSLLFNQIVACEYLEEYQKANVLMREYLEKYPGDLNAKREAVFLQSR